MIRSYVATTTISFVDFNFYVRPGDLLVHDTANHNRLTVYRNGQIMKVLTQTPLGISAFLKNKFIEEPPTTSSKAVEPVAPKAVEAPKATPVVADAPVTPPDVSKEAKERELKRRKVIPTTLIAEEYPDRLKEALALNDAELQETEK